MIDAAAVPLLDWLHSAGAVTDAVVRLFSRKPARLLPCQQPYLRIDAARPLQRISNLDGLDGGSGWGLVASRAAEPGDVLISLPVACQLSYVNEALPPALRSLLAQVPAELWGARLGLVLLEERAKGSASRFATYIKLLPAAFRGMPTFFAPDAVRALEYPPVTEQVKKRSRFLLSFSAGPLAAAAASQPAPFGGATVDANALGWALAAVSSRAYRTRGADAPPALLPLIDIANHSFEPNAKVVPGTQGAMLLKALAPIAPGEPLLVSYGNLQNDFLLMDYGFIIPGNPHDTAALSFSATLLDFAREAAGLSGMPFGSPDAAEHAAATGDDPVAAPWQRQLLTQLRLVGPGADRELRMGGASVVDQRLLAALRVLYCQDPAALRALPAGKQAAYLQSPDGQLSLANERAALATAAAVCAVALAQWKGTLADDESLLSAAQTPPLSDDMRLAVAFRANKKRLLSDAVKAIKAKLTDMAVAKPAQPAGRPMGKPPAPGGGGTGKPRASSSKARGKR